MNKEELLAELSRKTGCDLNQIDTFYESLIQIITEKLCLGEEVRLLPEWGVFTPKLWDNPGLNHNSPRRRSHPQYKIRFRCSRELEKELNQTDHPLHGSSD